MRNNICVFLLIGFLISACCVYPDSIVSAEEPVVWSDLAYAYDSYLENVDRMERDMKQRERGYVAPPVADPDDLDDYYPGIPAGPNSYRTRTSDYFEEDIDVPIRPPRPVSQDIEIMKAKSLQERDLIRKYKQKNPFDSRLDVFGNERRQRGAATTGTQALIEKYRVPEYEKGHVIHEPPWRSLKDQNPLDDRDLIQKYNSMGTPEPDNRDDWKLVEQNPLEDRDLIEKYNRIGAPNADNRDDRQLMEQDPLEDRDLIDKYQRIEPQVPETERFKKIKNRNPLDDRNLIQEYNDMDPYNSDNEDDLDLMEQNPLDDRDLLEKYDDKDISYNPGPPYQRDGPLGGLEMGIEAYQYTYEEPDFMELEGYTYGLFARYTRRLYRNNPIRSWGDIFGKGNGINYFQLEGRGSWGSLDYTSNGSGTHDDENHYTAELRGVVGYDIPFGREIIFTPYAGFGFRYLLDDSGGETTSAGYWTYDRESHYMYAPIGIEASKYFGQAWTISAKAEYDYFISGTQKSHLEDVSSSYSTLENDQHDGQGFRGSVKLTKNTRMVDFYLEPFYRYWHIEDSDVAPVTYSGATVGYGLEPENDTHEYGIKLGLQY